MNCYLIPDVVVGSLDCSLSKVRVFDKVKSRGSAVLSSSRQSIARRESQVNCETTSKPSSAQQPPASGVTLYTTFAAMGVPFEALLPYGIMLTVRTTPPHSGAVD
jgi:hypothetical protein